MIRLHVGMVFQSLAKLPVACSRFYMISLSYQVSNIIFILDLKNNMSIWGVRSLASLTNKH